MSNQMKRARTKASEPFGSAPNKMDGTGVMGNSGDPTFGPYKQDMGKDTLPYKSRETGMGTAKNQVNQLQTASTTMMRGRAKEATSSTVKRGPNKVRQARTSVSQPFKKSI